MSPRKVNFHTLGCKLNFSETSTLAREFARGGFERVAADAPADICVINSCSVTEHADKKCRNLIRKLHRCNPQAIIAVTGCYAQLKPQEIAAIEGVDLVLSNNDKGELYRRVAALGGKCRAQVFSCDTDSLTSFFAAFSSGDRTRAFLKVQDGCDYCCSYCTIHYARGASRNMPIADLVGEEAAQRKIRMAPGEHICQPEKSKCRAAEGIDHIFFAGGKGVFVHFIDYQRNGCQGEHFIKQIHGKQICRKSNPQSYPISHCKKSEKNLLMLFLRHIFKGIQSGKRP